jgi:hypothetical protein
MRHASLLILLFALRCVGGLVYATPARAFDGQISTARMIPLTFLDKDTVSAISFGCILEGMTGRWQRGKPAAICKLTLEKLDLRSTLRGSSLTMLFFNA